MENENRAYYIYELGFRNGVKGYEIEGVEQYSYRERYKPEDVLERKLFATTTSLDQAILISFKYNCRCDKGAYRRRLVKQYDAATGKLIRFYTSVTQASKASGIDYHKLSVKLKRKKDNTRTLKGCLWKYVENDSREKTNNIIHADIGEIKKEFGVEQGEIKICMFDVIRGKFLGCYDDFAEASAITRFSVNDISKSINFKDKLEDKYLFKIIPSKVLDELLWNSVKV